MDGAGGPDDARKGEKRQSISWGLLEPLRGPLSPLLDFLRPLVSGNVAVGVICALLFTMWFRAPSTPHIGSSGVGFHYLSAPERLLAYDELWRKEESELWDWLEERVGMEGLAVPVVDTEKSNSKEKRQQRVQDQKDLDSRLREEKMSEREIEDAIRVTQLRLDTLQHVVDQRKLDRKPSQDHQSARENSKNSEN